MSAPVFDNIEAAIKEQWIVSLIIILRFHVKGGTIMDVIIIELANKIKPVLKWVSCWSSWQYYLTIWSEILQSAWRWYQTCHRPYWSVQLSVCSTELSASLKKFAENTGIQRSSPDVGWAPLATITWGSAWTLLLLVMLIVNVVMLAMRRKRTHLMSISSIFGICQSLAFWSNGAADNNGVSWRGFTLHRDCCSCPLIVFWKSSTLTWWNQLLMTS